MSHYKKETYTVEDLDARREENFDNLNLDTEQDDDLPTLTFAEMFDETEVQTIFTFIAASKHTAYLGYQHLRLIQQHLNDNNLQEAEDCSDMLMKSATELLALNKIDEERQQAFWTETTDLLAETETDQEEFYISYLDLFLYLAIFFMVLVAIYATFFKV